MKVLITGGQGFMGSFLVDNLLAKGHAVTVFDRYWDKKKFKEYGWEDKVDFILGDLKDREVVLEAVNLHDVVVNLGGLLGTQEMINNAVPAVDVNIIGALNVFDAIKQFGKRGFQIAVGNYWMNNPYSITKNTAERFALMYNKEHGTDIRVLRGMNVYGPRQKHRPIRKIFPNVVIPALLNKPITIYGSGEQVMDLIYVEDIAEIMARLITYNNIPNDIIYEAGVGGQMTINKAVDMVVQLTNSQSEVKRVDMRPGEEKDSIVEISEEGWQNLEKYLDYTKQDLTSMEEAMTKSIVWYQDHLVEFPWDEGTPKVPTSKPIVAER